MQIVFHKGWEEFLQAFNIAAEPSNNSTVESNRGSLAYYINNRAYRSGTTSLTYLEENMKLVYIGIFFNVSSPLTEVYNEKLEWLKTGGFLDDWKLYEYLPLKLEEIGPQILTMDHLEVAFLLCLAPLSLCFAAFIAELIWSRMASFYKKCSQKTIVKKKIYPKASHISRPEESLIEMKVEICQTQQGGQSSINTKAGQMKILFDKNSKSDFRFSSRFKERFIRPRFSRKIREELKVLGSGSHSNRHEHRKIAPRIGSNRKVAKLERYLRHFLRSTKSFIGSRLLSMTTSVTFQTPKILRSERKVHKCVHRKGSLRFHK